MRPPIFDRVVRYFGTQQALADAIRAKPRNVWHWQTRGIPAKQALKIEAVTRGKFKLRELCPSAYDGLVQRRKRK